jgi:hypothetical protein
MHMSWVEDAMEKPMRTILIGGAILVTAPIVLPVLAGSLRPVAKRAVRGCLVLSERTKELVAEAKEQMNDLVAEAKAEGSAAGAADASS